MSIKLYRETQDVNIAAASRTSGIIDAFGRIRVSNPETIFDSKLLWDKKPLFWSEAITNGSGNATSTHSTAIPGVTMHVEAGDTIIRQTKTHWIYQAGKSQRGLFTGVLEKAGGGTGVWAAIGSFTATGGVFCELDGTTLGVTVRNGSTDVTVAQANFNIDKLDGTGRSGYTINPAKAQIFFIEFEWLGVGDIWFGVVANGEVYYAHQVKNANALIAAYMATPNLPVRYEISTTTATADMVQICSTVQSEGGLSMRGIDIEQSTGTTPLVNAVTANTIYAICGIRLKSTHLDANVFLQNVAAFNTAAANYHYFVAVNPTVAGALTWTGVAHSAVEFATTAGADPSAETVTAASWDFRYFMGYQVASGNQAKSAISETSASVYRLGSTIAGVADTHILCVQPTANSDIAAALGWRELV